MISSKGMASLTLITYFGMMSEQVRSKWWSECLQKLGWFPLAKNGNWTIRLQSFIFQTCGSNQAWSQRKGVDWEPAGLRRSTPWNRLFTAVSNASRKESQTLSQSNFTTLKFTIHTDGDPTWTKKIVRGLSSFVFFSCILKMKTFTFLAERMTDQCTRKIIILSVYNTE